MNAFTKFMIKLVIGLIILVGISVANWLVMTSLHPLSYYYTAPGLWLSLAISSAEACIIYPISVWYLNKICESYVKDNSN